jgi:outer membrane lipoprotein SlyB
MKTSNDSNRYSLQARIIAALPKPLRAPAHIATQTFKDAALPSAGAGIVGAFVGGMLGGPIGAAIGFASGSVPFASYIGVLTGGMVHSEVKYLQKAEYLDVIRDRESQKV